MKTAISLPDDGFYVAEETAQYMGIPRSELHLNALEEYLDKNSRAGITEKLNEVYDEDYYKEFELIEQAGLESIRAATKNDAW
jgi:hypothetical protein